MELDGHELVLCSAGIWSAMKDWEMGVRILSTYADGDIVV